MTDGKSLARAFERFKTPLFVEVETAVGQPPAAMRLVGDVEFVFDDDDKPLGVLGDLDEEKTAFIAWRLVRALHSDKKREPVVNTRAPLSVA